MWGKIRPEAVGRRDLKICGNADARVERIEGRASNTPTNNEPQFGKGGMKVYDALAHEFLHRIDIALSLAESKMNKAKATGGEGWLLDEFSTFCRNLKVIRNNAAEGRLPRQSRGETQPGTGLGIGRAMGEWCEDDELLDAAKAVEDFFRWSL